MGFFNRRYGPEDFYGFVVKAIGARAMAAISTTVRAMEGRRRTEVEQHDALGMQLLLAKLFERTNRVPVSPTIPPTFVVTAWKRAGCPEPTELVSSKAVLGR